MEIYDGEEWSEMDIEDLRSIIDAGATIEEAAEFLCRADSVNDVADTVSRTFHGPGHFRDGGLRLWDGIQTLVNERGSLGVIAHVRISCRLQPNRSIGESFRARPPGSRIGAKVATASRTES